MRRFAFFCCALLAWPIVSHAGECSGIPETRYLQSNAYEAVTVDATARSVTAASIGIMATVTVETAPLRFRVDGTDPTATEGHLVVEGTAFTLCGATTITRFRAIRTTGTSATIRVTHYRIQ